MHYTVFRNLHLSRLQLPTRILLTCFVLSVDTALWVGSLKYTQRAEWSSSGATRYWRGAEPADGAAPAAILSGEEEIADTGETTPALAPRKSAKFLVDTVHPHLFTVPIILFILLHLLVLTRLPDAAKIALALHAFLSFAATFGLPFWIASGGRGASLFVVAGANLMLNFVAVSAILLVETWRRPRKSAQPRDDGAIRSTADKGR